MRLIKKSKKHQKNHTPDNKTLLYAMVILSGFAIFMCIKWKKLASGSNKIKSDSLLQRVDALDKHLSELEIRHASLTLEQAPGRKNAGGKKSLSNVQKMLNLELPCPKGEFQLPEMKQCHYILECNEIYSDDLAMGVYFETGKTKKLQRGTWKGHEVALLHPVMEKGKSRMLDFYDTAKHLLDMNSPYVIQLVGFCNVSKSATEYGRSYIVTEYYKNRNLERFIQLPIHKKSDAAARLQLAVSYLKVLLFLHTSPGGPRIMCDSNDLAETLKQYVVTPDQQVLLADLDDLPVVDKDRNTLTQCKHQDVLAGRTDVERSFLAPEQVEAILEYLPESPLSKRWNQQLSGKKQPGVLDVQGRLPPSLDEKVDIFKIPNVTEAILLLKSPYSIDKDPHKKICLEIWKSLETIHLRCKSKTPSLRPTVIEVLTSYNKILDAVS